MIHILQTYCACIYITYGLVRLPEILSRLRKQDLEILRSCWYSRIDNFVLPNIAMRYFQQIFWFKLIDYLIRFCWFRCRLEFAVVVHDSNIQTVHET